MSTPTEHVPTRRARRHAATVDEILAAARSLLAAEGPSAVQLRAIAREMGVTAPALYRYFPSRDDLVSALSASLFDELVAELERARDAWTTAAPRLVAASRRFRRWGLAHPQELTLLFATPVPAPDQRSKDSVECQASERFAMVFLGLFLELWAERPFPIRRDDELDPRLVQQLGEWSQQTGLPLGVLEVFLRCWVRLYGTVVLEVSGHVAFAVEDAEPLFELELESMGQLVDVMPSEVTDAF